MSKIKQLSNVLHPEVLLGRRGGLIDRKFCEFLLALNLGEAGEEALSGVGKGMTVNDARLLTGFLDGLRSGSASILPQFAYVISDFADQFKAGTGEVLYVGRDFFKALSSVDRGLMLEVMPKKMAYFIASPFVEDYKARGAYVIKNEDSFAVYEVGGLDVPGLPAKFVPGTFLHYALNVPVPDPSARTFQDIAKSLPADSSKYSTKNEKLVAEGNLRVLGYINAAIYANSADPELAKLAPVGTLNKRQRHASRLRHEHENLCTVPVTVLNRSYAMGHIYHLDKTSVKGHLRWQPCGTGLTQVKLIWINEHERHFKKQDATSEQVHPL